MARPRLLPLTIAVALTAAAALSIVAEHAPWQGDASRVPAAATVHVQPAVGSRALTGNDAH